MRSHIKVNLLVSVRRVDRDAALVRYAPTRPCSIPGDALRRESRMNSAVQFHGSPEIVREMRGTTVDLLYRTAESLTTPGIMSKRNAPIRTGMGCAGGLLSLSARPITLLWCVETCSQRWASEMPMMMSHSVTPVLRDWKNVLCLLTQTRRCCAFHPQYATA